MEEAKVERLIKLLNMSTSASDNEALVAIRLANKMIRGEGESWDSLVCARTRIVYQERIVYKEREPKTRADIANSEEIRKAFDFFSKYKENLKLSEISWAERMHAFLIEKGYLTKKQFAVMQEAMNRVKAELNL